MYQTFSFFDLNDTVKIFVYVCDHEHYGTEKIKATHAARPMKVVSIFGFSRMYTDNASYPHFFLFNKCAFKKCLLWYNFHICLVLFDHMVGLEF